MKSVFAAGLLVFAISAWLTWVGMAGLLEDGEVAGRQGAYVKAFELLRLIRKRRGIALL